VFFTPDDPVNHTTASAQVELTILQGAPTITRHPASLIALRGNPVTFVVEVNEPDTLTYQWLRDGEPIPDATNPSLEIENAQFTDAGRYHVVVTSLGGSIESDPAHLTVIGIHLRADELPFQAIISIAGSPGNSYRIDTTDSLTQPGDWTLGIPFVLQDPLVDVPDDSSPNTNNRFYRVIHLNPL
jgi:hypothetical protein